MRWAGVGDRWPTRNAAVARLIEPGSSVLDLGAGAQGLRAALPDDCDYTPADLPEFDMNGGDWPSGWFDVVVMSGVLEYADDPEEVFERLRSLAPRAIITYAHGRKNRDRDWSNLTRLRFTEFARRAGWVAVSRGEWRAPHIVPQEIWELT